MTGRQRRKQEEYRRLMALCSQRDDIDLAVTGHDKDGVPYAYEVRYKIRSICGINDDMSPRFADEFLLSLVLPEDYPMVDAPPMFRFVSHPSYDICRTPYIVHHPPAYAMPWHPNIRYYGEMAGRVCINAMNTYTDLSWGVERIALYLRYELYHAIHEPPYPEDLKVAEWVRRYGEPNDWIFFDQETKQ